MFDESMFGGHPKITGWKTREKIREIEKTGRVTKGEALKLAKEKVKEITNADYVVLTSSGTIACLASVKAWTVMFKRKPVVNIPSFTYHSVPRTIEEILGLRIVFSDIDGETWHSLLEKVGDLYIPMDTFGSLAPRPHHYDKPEENVIYDACHSFGTRHEVRGIAEFGSFSGGKVVTAGEGGYIATNSRKFFAMAENYADMLGRIPELSASLLLDYIDVLDPILEKRRENKKIYTGRLSDLLIFQKIPFATNNYIIAGTYRTVESKRLFEELMATTPIFRKYYRGIRGNEESIRVANNHVCLPNGFYVDPEKVCDYILTY